MVTDVNVIVKWLKQIYLEMESAYCATSDIEFQCGQMHMIRRLLGRLNDGNFDVDFSVKNKTTYVYHYIFDGDIVNEYSHVFLDKLDDVYIVVPDSAYLEFMSYKFDSDVHVEILQPDYLL